MKKLLIISALLIAQSLYAQSNVSFHNFSWGTSFQEFSAKMGNPAFSDDINGLRSVVYDNLMVSGYPAFMVAYFSKDGLEGGTYYFHTFSLEELMQCYSVVQKDLLGKFGATRLCMPIFRELFPYESSWDLNSGYVHLKVDTRKNEPVTLWYSSPSLTKILAGS
jgi:hypothetical protein